MSTLLLASARVQWTCFFVRLFIQFLVILQWSADTLTDPFERALLSVITFAHMSFSVTIFTYMSLVPLSTLLLAPARVQRACFIVMLFIHSLL